MGPDFDLTFCLQQFRRQRAQSLTSGVKEMLRCGSGAFKHARLVFGGRNNEMSA